MKSGVLLSSLRLCDKFDRSMTFGKQETDDRTDYRNGDSRKKKLQPVEWESVAYGSSTEHCRLRPNKKICSFPVARPTLNL